MRLVQPAVIAAVVVGALAGCTDAPLASSPVSVDRSSSIPPVAPTGALRATTPASTLSADETRGLESTPWAIVAETGTRLTIKYVAGGGCSEWKGIRLHETARSVEIWTAVKNSSGDQACPADLLLGESTIQLARPLATRRLLHAPVSPHWKSYTDDF